LFHAYCIDLTDAIIDYQCLKKEFTFVDGVKDQLKMFYSPKYQWTKYSNASCWV